ncbi:hypothetical protein GSY74_03740 [Sulfurovum sp. bin170]|uniref:hypothetical protein n=1 Tax=Sulfurovum sp. bin170 TaxID=2695268 RepID=UPI0013DFC0C5|nr:hypothetical protein [Sulfurovum sp. bin170]NEW60384.1 hypothetical protein [Sulfurovum sp. bin170]
MKNILIFSTIALLLVGCDVHKKDMEDITLLDKSESVDFEATGRYDLREYILPAKSQTNIYQRVKLRDSGGDREYKEPYMINNDDHIEYLVDGDTIKELYDTDYTITDSKIIKKELVDDFYDIREYRRNLNIGDFYYIYEYVDAESVLYQVGYTKCKVTEHLDTQEILDKSYSDILHLSCEQESKEGVRGEFSERKIFVSEYYYAKNIGQIAAVGEVCTEKTYDKTYRQCTKTTKKLINIVD